VINTSIDYRQQAYEVDSLWEVTPISTDLAAGVGYSYIDRDYRGSLGTNTQASGPSLIAAYSNLEISGAQITPETGFTGRFVATDYTPNDALEREDYRVYSLAMQKYFSMWLPRHHAIMLRLQGQYIDQDPSEISIADYAFTVPSAPFANTLNPFYIMRGYLPGQFLGKSLANYSVEYRFPIAYFYKGWGTAPLFLKRMHMALLADGITLDGYSYNNDAGLYERVDSWHQFWSAGAELKLDITLAYHFPVTAYVGVYAPQDSRYKDGQRFAIGFQF
jgi:hypothetical protein